jgi:hypothetical protein
MGEGLKRVAKACGGLTVKAGGKTVRYDENGNVVLTYRCIFCGMDSGTSDQIKFAYWYRAHRTLTCRPKPQILEARW